MLVITSDHGGYALKQEIMAHLTKRGVAFDDIGTYSEESCNYPEYAEKAARAVVAGQYEKGILICGTGIGMSIAANKVHGARCALLTDCYSAEMCRAHNDANLIALGGRTIGPELAKRIVDLFLSTEFMGEQHAVRIGMFPEIEKRQ